LFGFSKWPEQSRISKALKIWNQSTFPKPSNTARWIAICGYESREKKHVEACEKVASHSAAAIRIRRQGGHIGLSPFDCRTITADSESSVFPMKFPRAQKPFVSVNCATLTETLLESELFGYEKGAFTGAVTQKKGKMEVAEGGTFFLDEIGELAPALQAKLLRVLQERAFDRVGGTRTIKVNIRLIAATNRNLEEAAKAGRFRQDLFFRLNVVPLTVPALRERRVDIPLLANYFTSELAKKIGRRVKGISPEAQKYLTHYDWPGNVRELENAIERAIVLGTTELILPEDLPEFLLQNQSQSGLKLTDYHQAIKETKRQLVLKVLEQAHGNYINAARLLGIHPNNLHRLIRELNLKPPSEETVRKGRPAFVGPDLGALAPPDVLVLKTRNCLWGSEIIDSPFLGASLKTCLHRTTEGSCLCAPQQTEPNKL
jgi:hypothetical protein